MVLDLRGLNPAPVTPFTPDGDVDYDAIQRLGAWLGSIDGVKSLVVLGHDTSNLTEGHGGPRDATVLFAPEDVVPELGGLVVERAETVSRTVTSFSRPPVCMTAETRPCAMALRGLWP